MLHVCIILLILAASSAGSHKQTSSASSETAKTILSACSNFGGEWISVNGEYIGIQQKNCTVTAINPAESWSPQPGFVTGNALHMFNIVGIINGSLIHWNDGPRTVWQRMIVPPLNDGLAEIRSMLQTAIETEQSVIQPYMSALYSIHPGTNKNATSILHGVAIEEMLHMTSAANILNAIGGHPRMNERSFVPVYPMMLPYVNISVSLTPFTKEQVALFRLIEEPTWGPDNHYRIRTVGVFYFEIGLILDGLVKKYGEASVFSGDPALQVNTTSSRGRVQGVYSHADAKRLLTGILREGEGVKGSLFDTSPFNGRQDELSHYFRFNEIVHDRCYELSDNASHVNDPTGDKMGIDWNAIYDFVPNPRASEYSAHPEIQQKMMEFNSCYTQLLAGLHVVFNGSPASFMSQIHLMYTLGSLAKELMATPVPGRNGMMVGVPWEWVDINSASTPECPMLQENIVL